MFYLIYLLTNLHLHFGVSLFRIQQIKVIPGRHLHLTALRHIDGTHLFSRSRVLDHTSSMNCCYLSDATLYCSITETKECEQLDQRC